MESASEIKILSFGELDVGSHFKIYNSVNKQMFDCIFRKLAPQAPNFNCESMWHETLPPAKAHCKPNQLVVKVDKEGKIAT